jgi:hypothetical protein
MEDQSQSVQAKSLQNPILENPSLKRDSGGTESVDPEFKPWYHKKIK